MIKRAGESKFALLHTHGDTVYDTFIGELIVLVKNYAASMGSRPDSWVKFGVRLESVNVFGEDVGVGNDLVDKCSCAARNLLRGEKKWL